MCCIIFQNEKTHFQAIKTSSSKTRKIDIFANPWFCSKIGHFSIFSFLGNIGQENVFYDILERKNALLGNKDKKFKKSKNSHFSKGVNPWFPSKIGLFSIFLFQAIQARKLCFMIFQNEKTHCQAIKKNKKSGKIHIFPKGLTHGFPQKLAIFPSFLLSNIGKEIFFL